MSSDPGVGRRSSVITDEERRLAQDDRLADDVREDIARRVDERYLPSVLSREALVEIVTRLSDSEHAEAVAEDLGCRDLRRWVGDLCDIDYEPGGQARYYPFRRYELKLLDYVLEDFGLEADAEIETKNPPLAETRRGSVPPTTEGDD